MSESNFRVLRIALVIIIAVIQMSVNAQCDRERDSLALVTFYNTTSGLNWNLVEPMNQWDGIFLNSSGCVDIIALNNNNITGVIGEEFSELKQLREWQMANNNLSGNLPIAIGDMSLLKGILLYDNNLAGSIPASLAQISTLERVYLQGNDLSGCYPEELGVGVFCTLGYSEFTFSFGYNFDGNDKLPWQGEVSNFCQGLSQVGASCEDSNPLTVADTINESCFCVGSIGSGNFPCDRERDSLALVDLYTSTNGPSWTNKWNLDTPISTWYGIELNAQGCVECLDLDGGTGCSNTSNSGGNNLTGTLPESIGQLKNCIQVNLSNNFISGSIPDSIIGLRACERLDLGSNDLSGDIPSGISSMPVLERLLLDDNAITGPIPQDICAGPVITTVRLDDNNLVGSLPLGAVYSPSLFSLNLSRNSVEGQLPAELFNHPNLYFLGLSENLLDGSLPDIDPDESSLQLVYLNDNNFSGAFPSQILNLSNLERLDLSNNTFSGSLPDAFNQVMNLEHLLLYNNQLSGVLPPTIGQLSNLRRFYLQNNNFRGCYPESYLDLCPWMGYSEDVTQNGLNLDGNLLLPFEGYFKDYCNGQAQVGAPCNDSNLATAVDLIDESCTCTGISKRTRDSLLLVDFYEATNGTEWTISWDLSQPITDWHGVFLGSEESVICLSMNGEMCSIEEDASNNLTGFLPESFGDFSDLQSVNLSNNEIGERIPGTLSKLTQLNELNLSFNKFSSIITHIQWDFADLDYLNLSNNILAGCIPQTLLPYCDNSSQILNNNQLMPWSGDISSFCADGIQTGAPCNIDSTEIYSIDNCSCVLSIFCDREQDSLALVSLYNATNGQAWDDKWDLSTPITEWYGLDVTTNGCVQRIVLRFNDLEGTLPEELGQLTNLTELRLEGSFSGPVPSSLSNLTLLEELELNGGFEGEVAIDFNELTELESLSLENNHFTGLVPEAIFNLSNLTSLDLSGNAFEGPIPDGVENLTSLTFLHLGSNKFIGDIPDAIASLTNLTFLNLRFNQLTGNIPAFIANLTNLRILDLSNNTLDGTIPSNLDQLQNLWDLKLQHNSLEGLIPASLGNISGLQNLWLYNNELTGNIPESFTNLDNLPSLDLNHNNLTGEVPSFLGEMDDLIQLRIQNNHFSGDIPFDAIDNIRFLIINNNDFTFENLEGREQILFVSYDTQNPFYPDTVLQVLSGQDLTIDLAIDPTIVSSRYAWFKDDEVFAVDPINPINSNMLIIPSVSNADAGIYNSEVTNVDHPDLTLLSSGIGVKVCNTESDSLELVALYNSTNGAGWNNSLGWLTDGVPISNWYGITTNDLGCISKIDLSDNNLNGTIPSLDLNTLDTLYLENNLLSGSLPDAMNVPFLKAINLEQNAMTGPIPPVISSWMFLTNLNLSNNEFGDNIPPDLGDLCEMVELQLDGNVLSGEVPEELTQLFNLQPGLVDFGHNPGIDSLKPKLAFFCPFGEQIFEETASFDRFLGICNVQCSGFEWEDLLQDSWLTDTLVQLPCASDTCAYANSQAGYVDVRGITVIFTLERCYTALEPPTYIENIDFFDCAGNLLESVVCDEDEFCTDYGAIAEEEFDDLDFITIWNCGQAIPVCAEGLLPGSDCDDENPQTINDIVQLDCDCLGYDDLDGDGFDINSDCDDTDPFINPNAQEIANNGIDEDCDGEDLTSSLEENHGENFIVFPNPTRGTLYINSHPDVECMLSLFDLQGNTLLKSSNVVRQIDLNDLESGVYILMLEQKKTGFRQIEKIHLLR